MSGDSSPNDVAWACNKCDQYNVALQDQCIECGFNRAEEGEGEGKEGGAKEGEGEGKEGEAEESAEEDPDEEEDDEEEEVEEVRAEIRLGKEAYFAHRPADARSHFEAAARSAGSVNALGRIGLIYDEELEDNEEALRWYQRGADLGDKDAELNMQYLLRDSQARSGKRKFKGKVAKKGKKLARKKAKLAQKGAKLAQKGAKLAQKGVELAQKGAKLAQKGARLAESKLLDVVSLYSSPTKDGAGEKLANCHVLKLEQEMKGMMKYVPAYKQTAVPATSFDEIEPLLTRYCPKVLSFSGHGDAQHQASSLPMLCFQLPNGKMEVPDPNEFADLVKEHCAQEDSRLKTLFLNGCSTGQLAAIINARVPSLDIIYWGTRVQTNKATAFAAGVFRSIGKQIRAGENGLHSSTVLDLNSAFSAGKQEFTSAGGIEGDPDNYLAGSRPHGTACLLRSV
jgi:hypothetical protein